MNEKEVLSKLLENNKGIVSRNEAVTSGISSMAFTRFIREYNLIKVAPGIYIQENYFSIDQLYLIQQRYPRIVYSGLTGLYLHNLLDKVPDMVEFSIDRKYRVRKESIKENITIHIVNDNEYLNFANVYIKTNMGNIVNCYSREKLIVEMIKKRNEYDGETFIKVIKRYLKCKDKNLHLLFECAKKRNVEKQVFEIMEIMGYED